MKKFFLNTTALLLISSLSPLLLANAQQELQQRLNKIENLSADYTQSVTSADGQNVQQGSGKLQIKRPNLFRIESETPQQSQIIADGKTLWFYDPFIQQVSANWVDDILSDTPFLLLTSNNQRYWDQYSVQQNIDSFSLQPKSATSNIKQFDIRVDANGILKNFSIIEKDGQRNLYVLRNITNSPLSTSLFQFTLPQGVELDDQRK